MSSIAVHLHDYMHVYVPQGHYVLYQCIHPCYIDRSKLMENRE